MYTLFAAIVPVFIIILIGMAVERTSLIPESAGQVLDIFVVNVAMPCLLFHAMSQVTVEQLAQGGWWLVQVAAQLIFLRGLLCHRPSARLLIRSLRHLGYFRGLSQRGLCRASRGHEPHARQQ